MMTHTGRTRHARGMAIWQMDRKLLSDCSTPLPILGSQGTILLQTKASMQELA